ncbi:MAG: acyl-CoA dehydratase activase-related protein [Actinomycetota bacterium]
MTTIGIPRALSYYRYYPLWKKLLEGMGAQVVLSRATGKRLLEDGVRHCVDDICVPVKLYYGHVLDVAGRCDAIFISRVVSVEKTREDTYTCPKLIGLPDMIKSSLDGLPPLLEFVMDAQACSLKSSAKRLGSELGATTSQVRSALSDGLEAQGRYEALLSEGVAPEKAMGVVLGNGNGSGEAPAAGGRPPDVTVALVGHEYLVHDAFISHGLVRKLEKLGATVVHMSQVPGDVVERELALYPGIAWSYEKELLGSASHFLGRDDIDGVMMVIGFACGPDSIIVEIITREVARDSGPPMTTLVLDEHTGEAGVSTRVEAFVDLIRRSRRR